MTEAIRRGDIPGVQIRRRGHVAGVGAARVWEYLVVRERLEDWLADRAEVEPGPTGGFELYGDGEDPGRYEIGDTVDWEPARRWVLAFRRADWTVSTRLELVVTEDAAGSELSILQQGFEHLPLSDGLTLWEAYRRRWRRAVDRLAEALSV